MARRDDGFLSTRRKVAWMFFGLWAVVLVMAAVRYAVHGDMVVSPPRPSPSAFTACGMPIGYENNGGCSDFRMKKAANRSSIRRLL
jgi:hypothetical protein